MAYGEQAIHLARSGGDGERQARGNLAVGRALLGQGKYAEAQRRLETCLKLAQEGDLPSVEAECLLHLGTVATLQTDDAHAQSRYESALRIYVRLDNRRDQIRALNNLAIVSRRQGEFARALDAFERALPLAATISDLQEEANLLTNLGLNHARLGDVERAEFLYRRALTIFQEIRNRASESLVLANLAFLYHQRGEQARAVESAHRSYGIALQVNALHLQAHALTYLGHAQLALGRYDAAGQAPHDDCPGNGRGGQAPHDDCPGNGRGGQAYEESLRLCASLGDAVLAVETRAGLAQLNLARGNRTEALALAEEILPVLETRSLEDADDPVRVHLTCYRVLAGRDDTRARALLQNAHRLLRRRAEKIADARLRRSYLENIPSHRQVERQWGEIGGGE